MTLFEIIKKNLTKQNLVEMLTRVYIRGVCDCATNKDDWRKYKKETMIAMDQEQDDKEIDVDVEAEG